jgi:hypothetical protein
MSDIDDLFARADAALANFQGRESSLYRRDGTQIYADAEMARRREALLVTLDAELAAIGAEQEQVAAKAARRLTALAGYDPFDGLGGEALADATSWLSVASSDASVRPPEWLGARLRALLAASPPNRAQIAAHHRAFSERAEAIEREGHARPGGFGAEESIRLRVLNDSLASASRYLGQERRDQERREIEDEIERGKSLVFHLREVRRIADGSQERDLARSREAMRAAF